MPILKPQIQEALREAGLLQKSDNPELGESLDAAGLSLESTLEVVEDLMHRSQSDSVRHQAVSTALKLRGLMKEERQPLPSITIVINDPESKHTINPILLPRELTI